MWWTMQTIPNVEKHIIKFKFSLERLPMQKSLKSARKDKQKETRY